MHFALNGAHIPLFVGCLKALPNLYALEIAKFNSSATEKFRTALWGVDLPQIKILILPATAHPLLEHCQEVEDVCVVASWNVPPDVFLGSLPFNWNSKVRRLAIPLTKCDNPSRKSLRSLCKNFVQVEDLLGFTARPTSGFATVCPQLTELTFFYPLPGHIQKTKHGVDSETLQTARIIPEIVNACRLLPNFDTVQIVYCFGDPLPRPSRSLFWRNPGYDNTVNTWCERRIMFEEELQVVKDKVIRALEQNKCDGGGAGEEGRDRVMVRVIELLWSFKFNPGGSERRSLFSMNIKEHKVD